MKTSRAIRDFLASLIGQTVYDYGLGDVRKARGVWALMEAPMQEEVQRVVALMLKYSGGGQAKKPRAAPASRLAGM